MRGRRPSLWEAHHDLDLGAEQVEIGPEGVSTITQQLSPEALDTLIFAGFSGIFVDTHGFWDRGLTISRQLQQLIGQSPVLSRDGRFEFFNLVSFATTLRAKYTAEQWEAERLKALAIPSK